MVSVTSLSGGSRTVDAAHGSGFRPDIEGLRALAVLPILLNHALVRGFAGGFVGVDVFFVISGYLITLILMRDLQSGAFSIKGFYRRRILRILPALFVMLGVVTAAGFVWLTPNEFTHLAKSSLATTFFVSNLLLYSDTGYFTTAAATLPLLHTWSLAIEEQFYIFWPIVLLLAVRLGARMTLAAVVGICLLSLAASQWMVVRDPSAAFYLIPFRTWELGLGGVLAILQLRSPAIFRRQDGGLPMARNLLAAAGLAAILYCVYAYRQPIVFPGLSALPPTLGTVAIIAAGSGAFVNRMLALPPVRFFGRISYSLYLWHWPVIVFSKLALFLPETPAVIAGQLVVSVVLAWISYELVETRLRAVLARQDASTVLWRAGVAMAASALVSLTILRFDGFARRYSDDQLAVAGVLDRDQERDYRRGTCFVVEAEDRFDRDACLASDERRPSLLLAGDSVAAHLWPGLAAVATGYAIGQATMVGCRPYVGNDPRLPCSRFFDTLLGEWTPQMRPDLLMLAGNWIAADAAPLRSTLEKLVASGQATVVVGPMPRYDSSLPRLLFFGTGPDPGARARASLSKNLWRIDAEIGAAARSAGALYVSLLDLLCPAGECPIYAKPNVPLQFDYVHLTTEGSELVVARMMERINALRRDDGLPGAAGPTDQTVVSP